MDEAVLRRRQNLLHGDFTCLPTRLKDLKNRATESQNKPSKKLQYCDSTFARGVVA